MHSRPLRAAIAAVLCAAVVLSVASCSSFRADPPSEPASGSTDVRTDSDASPVIFSFRCGTGDATSTYLTYSAVWQAHERSCTAARVTGSKPSEQQQAAVDATRGAASLESLAADCAVTGAAPWATAVASAEQADVAAGLLRYCPGHPEFDHLQDALAAYRG